MKCGEWKAESGVWKVESGGGSLESGGIPVLVVLERDLVSEQMRAERVARWEERVLGP